jgi:hypothetical protein
MVTAENVSFIKESEKPMIDAIAAHLFRARQWGDAMKVESTDMQERAQQLWRELDGLDWSSHELAITGILRDALEEAYRDGHNGPEQPVEVLPDGRLRPLTAKEKKAWRKRTKTRIRNGEVSNG